MRELRYKPPPTVKRFLKSDAFVRGIVGPVGSGKSSGCNLELVRRSKMQARGPDGIRRSRWVVVRNTYGQLADTTRKTFEEWVPQDLGSWNEQRFQFNMKFDDVEAEILFRALDRPEDVQKLLSLDITGAYVNEGREVPRAVLDILQTRAGRYPSKAHGGATWSGIWFDTNPWHDGHWGQDLFAKKLPGHELYRQPGGRDPDAENVENLLEGYYDRLCIGKDREWIRVYVDGKDASGAVGSVFGEWITDLANAGRVSDFDHPSDGIITNWDLGTSDSTAIWFWRIGPEGVDVVDYYENSGEGAPHYMDVCDAREWGNKAEYVRHLLPHDGANRSWQTGVSTRELMLKRWPNKIGVMPQLGIADGLDAVRWLLEQPIRIHSRCAQGLKALRSYRFEFDETKQVFSKTPVHDWASHGADAFRYLAQTVKRAELMKKAKDKANEKAAPAIKNSWSLEKEFTTDLEDRAERRR